MRRTVVFAAFSFLLLVWGCGKGGTNNNPTPPPVTGADKLTLALFAAPWCQNCPKELQELDQRFKGFTKSAQVTTIVYITSGDYPRMPPSQDIADKYKTKLGVGFNFQVDPWPLTYYRRYIQADGQDLPAAVILDEKGNAVKLLAPGQYTPVDVITELRARLK